MLNTLVLSNSTATNEVRELTVDELELIAGGGCPKGVKKTLAGNALGLGIAGGILGGPVGALKGAAGGVILGTFECAVGWFD